MNILCLHRMGDPQLRLEAVRSLEYMFAEVRSDLNVLVHDANIPFPSYMKDIEYDLIVLGPTFLCSRYSSRMVKQTLRDYDFVKHSTCCKVALPQDDYDCSAILENWLIDWNISVVYTVCPDNWNALYPILSKRGLLRLGYTGYISQDWINAWTNPKCFDSRHIDVSYRASKLPANFGSLGQLKWQIAGRFLASLDVDNDLHLDVSVDHKDRIPGTEWHAFLEDSKFCLTTPSGSSLLDPYGSIRSSIKQYLRRNPFAAFADIESACFPGQDCRYLFSALSPRNLEAALAETVQIATPGSYSGLMQPFIHFIPIEEDCSNISDVLAMISDKGLVKEIQKRCKDSILSEPRLRRLNIVNEIVAFAENFLSNKAGVASVDQNHVRYVFDLYRSDMLEAERSFWIRRRYLSRILASAKEGARYICNTFNVSWLKAIS
jgi:hypothetical protein